MKSAKELATEAKIEGRLTSAGCRGAINILTPRYSLLIICRAGNTRSRLAFSNMAHDTVITEQILIDAKKPEQR